MMVWALIVIAVLVVGLIILCNYQQAKINELYAWQKQHKEYSSHFSNDSEFRTAVNERIQRYNRFAYRDDTARFGYNDICYSELFRLILDHLNLKPAVIMPTPSEPTYVLKEKDDE